MSKDKIMTALIVIIILLAFRYFNLCVFEEFETQLEGLMASKEQLENAIVLQDKIEFQKKVTIFLIIFCFVLFYPITFFKKKI